MKAAIVIATVREENIIKFLEVWRDEFASHDLILVEDNPQRSFAISCPNFSHYSWEEIDREFGRNSWIFPRRTDCIRSYGFYKAYQRHPDMIVTLDDDCYPETKRFLEKHYERLSSPASSNAWIATGNGLLPRGVPYEKTSRELKCVINHGLWTNQPDYDALTQLVNKRLAKKFEPVNQVIPKGLYFPMCGMNLAWLPEVTAAMYFLLMGKDWPFDRFGDIWCGIFVKKICDHLGYGVRSGEPLVEHQRASNVWANLGKELPGYEINETLWQAVDSIVLSATTFTGDYRELAEKLPIQGEYWDRLRTAMRTWSDLFPEHS